MSRPVIAVAESAFPDRVDIAREFEDRAEIRWIDLSSPATTRRSTRDVDAVVVTLQHLSAEIIEAFGPGVRVIGRAGVGLDTIDLEAAAAHAVAVVNQPAYGAQEVASHAVGLLLAVSRRLLAADGFVRGGWQGAAPLGRIRPLDELVVGVLGCGRIGRTFIGHIRPMVSEVLVYDPVVSDVPPGTTRVEGLDALLGRSEMLSLHLPLTAQTRNLIGRRELLLLPEGAVIVNVSRGGIVDEVALAELLHSGHLGGAGFDVFAEEPLPATSPLLEAPNTVLTPHCAAVSTRAAFRLSRWTIADAIEYVRNGSVLNGTLVVAPGVLAPGVADPDEVSSGAAATSSAQAAASLG